MELPPGFRFHPTDEELITHYLSNKVLDPNFNAIAIGEVDLIKCEPWDLPWKAKMGEKEWYFFCVRDRKYPTGLRTNRATESGYWKATGKDKDIYRLGKKSLISSSSLSLSLSLVGMKKTLVFYRGRAPKGEKTNWIMHEYRLEGKYSACNLPKTAKNEWVICRVFKKSTSSGGKQGCSSGTMGLQIGGCSSNELEQRKMSLLLPQLMDVNPSKDKDKGIRATESPEAAAAAEAHVTCFSNTAVLGDQKGKGQEEESITISPTLSLVADYFNTSSTTTPFFLSSASSISNYPHKSHHHVSPSSLFIANINMSASLENSEQHYVHPNNVSLMHLLQSNVYVLNGNIGNEQRSCKADKEILSNISQETGISTTDINPEISSVNNNNSNNEIVNAQEVPSTSASLHLEDCLWNY